MDWIAPTIAIVAALFAGWQAWEARKARKQADVSAELASKYEKRAVEASEQIAAIEAARFDVERQERAKYRNPWSMVRLPTNGGARAYKFVLGGDEALTDVRVTAPDENESRAKFRLTKSDAETMRPGESMTLQFFRGMGSPTQVTAEVHWVRPSGEAHSSPVTLD